MRRGTILERFQEMVERLDLSLGELKRSEEWVSLDERPHSATTLAVPYLQDFPEDLLLQFGVVHPHRSAANLHTIQNQIVVLPTDVLVSALF